MDLNELVKRYNAGETDLTSETTFIYNEQGKNAAYDFARAIDEMIGSSAYNTVLAQISKLETLGKMPQINQKAVIEGELYKASLKRDKALKQIEQEQLAKTLQDNKNPKTELSMPNKMPLYEFEKEKGYKTKEDIFKPAADISKTNILLIGAVVLIILGYYFYQKK